MPPDISAGLIALTGPPGAASIGKPAEAPASRTVSAAVFASLLTQSSPLSLKLAAPKADTAPTIKLGFAAKPQISKNPKTLSILKTMDTLLPLSFPSTGTAMKASELLLLNTPSHKNLCQNPKSDPLALNNGGIGQENSALAPPLLGAGGRFEIHSKSPTENSKDAAKAPAVAPNTAANVLDSGLSSVPIPVPVFVQAAPVPAVLPPASAPTSSVTVPVASVSSAPASVIAAPASALLTAQRTLSAALAPSIAAAGPLVPMSTPAPAASLVPPHSAPKFEPAAPSSPAPSGVLLPRTWTLPAPASAEMSPVFSRPAPPVTPPTAAAFQAVSPLVQAARVAPPALYPASPQGQAPLQAQAAPQGTALPLMPNPATPILTTVSSSVVLPSTASLTAASVLAEPATPSLAAPAPAKSTGKFGQIALKPASKNADINTRTLSLEAPAAAGKTAASAVVSAKTPALATDSQSQPSVGKKPLETDNTLATHIPLAAQAAPLEAQGTPGSKPLSVADHAAMVRQVADGVGAMPLPAKPGGVQQMSLQLHPKDWGSLQVSVAVTPGQEPGAATVTAHIVAETPQVKAALQSQTGALHQALRASGLNLTHLTVSVKPASETVKPAAQSASAGFSGGQGQPSGGSSQAHPTQVAPGSQSAGTHFGTSAGNSQNGRQGQPPVFTSSTAQAEAEETAPVQLSIRPSGRIDTHA